MVNTIIHLNSLVLAIKNYAKILITSCTNIEFDLMQPLGNKTSNLSKFIQYTLSILNQGLP